MTACQACAAKSQTFLCPRCITELRTLLDHLPQWLEWLGDSAIGRTRMGDTGKGSTRREPFKGDDQALARCGCGHREHEGRECGVEVESG